MQPTSQLHPVTTSPPSQEVPTSRALQDTGSNIPLRTLGPEGRGVRNETPYPQVDTRNERTIRTHTGEGDRTASVLPSAKPPYPQPSSTKPSASYPPPSAKPSAPPPPLKQPSASTSLLSYPTGTSHLIPQPSASASPPSYPPAPTLAKAASSQMNTPKGAPPIDPQAPSRGSTFESPHHSGGRGSARPRADEQGRKESKDPLTASHRQPATLEYTSSATESPRRRHKEFKDPSTASHRQPATLEYTPSTTESPRWGYKDASAVPPTYSEHISNATERLSLQDRKDPCVASHRPPAPPTGYGPDIKQNQNPFTEGPIQRTDSSYHGHGYDSKASHLPDTSNSRKKTGQPSNTAPPSDRREFPITPPAALVSTQHQTHPSSDSSMSHSNSTTSSTNLWSPPPGDARTHLTTDKSFVFLANLD